MARRRRKKGQSIGTNDRPGVQRNVNASGRTAGPLGVCADGPSWTLLAGMIAGVVVVVLIAHWPVLSMQALCFDDSEYLVRNELVRSPSWASVRAFMAEILEPSSVRGYYQPLSMLSLMLDYALGGSPDDLTVFHVTSLLLHLVNTVLVVILLYQLFGQPIPAALVGLVFGVHPINVESIPWVGERKTLLAAFFVLVGLVLYMRYVRHRGWKVYILCLVSFIFALMSKPTSVPLPMLLLLLDYWPLNRLSRKAIIEKIPFLVIGGVFAIITMISQGRTSEVTMPGGHGPVRIVLIVAHNIIFYLYKILCPVSLSPHYPYPEPLTLSHPMVLAGVLGTCALAPALILSLRWTRSIVIGWLFFFVAIFPAIGVVGFANTIAADRFAYLPMVGLLLPLVVLLARLWGKSADASSSTGRRLAMLAVLAVVVIAYSAGTRKCLKPWKDTETLHRHMVDYAPCASEPRCALGANLAKRGLYDQAIEQYRISLECDPQHLKSMNNLGHALAYKHKYDEAIEVLSQAVKLRPDFASAHANLGNVLTSKGRYDEAVVHFKRALEIDPHHAAAYGYWGVAMVNQNRLNEAAEYLKKAVALKPDYADAYNNLGAVLLRQGKINEGIAYLDQALKYKPAQMDALFNRGWAMKELGRIDEAIESFREALRVNPGNKRAQSALKQAMAQKRK